jgi:hypothetical protein
MGFAQIPFAVLPANKPVVEKKGGNVLADGFRELGMYGNR